MPRRLCWRLLPLPPPKAPAPTAATPALHTVPQSAMQSAGAAALAASSHAGAGLEGLHPAGGEHAGEAASEGQPWPASAKAAAADDANAARVAAPGEDRPVSRSLRMPWAPLLTAEEVKRGLAYYGSGQRMEALAAKLMAGRPIKIFTLGGSVTKGQGASSPEAAYPSRLFEFLNANFPHKWAQKGGGECWRSAGGWRGHVARWLQVGQSAAVRACLSGVHHSAHAARHACAAAQKPGRARLPRRPLPMLPHSRHAPT